MSKQKLGVLASLCAALLLSMSIVFGSILFVQAESIDASVSRLLSVDTRANADGDSKVTFVINKNLGTTTFTDAEVAGVTYTTADGTRTLKDVTYYFDNDRILPVIQLSFNEDSVTEGAVQYAEGDTIAFTTDFSFSNEAGDQTFTLGEAITVTYTGGEWTGSFIGDSITSASTSVANDVAVYLAGGCVQFDFGVTNVAEGEGLSDANGGGGWYDANTSVAGKTYKTLASHIEVNTGDGWAPSRFVFQNGKIAIGDINSHLSDGATIVIKAGFPVWQTSGTKHAGMYFNSASNYTPVAILTTNLLFRFDGSAWSAASPATSAEVTNKPSAALGIGQSLQLEWTINENAVEPTPVFSSSAPDIVSVSDTGMLTALDGGTAKITLQFTNIEVSFDVTVEGEAVVTGYEISIAGAATKDGQQYLVAYVGEELDAEFAASRLTAVPVYEDESKGDSFAVTADMLDVESFDNTTAGATTLSMTHEDVSAQIPVWLYEVQAVDPVAPGRLSAWSSAINVYFFDVVEDNQGEVPAIHTIDFRFAPEYGIDKTMATLVEPSWVENPATHELYTVGEITKIQCLLYFGGIDAIPIGSVLTLTENFRFYRNIDNTWVAVYKLNNPAQYVWDGSAWQNYVDEANDFTLDVEEITLPCGASYAPEVTILPEGAYAQVSLESDEPDIVSIVDGEMVAMAPGDAVITVSLGKAETKTIRVTVEDTEPAGLQLVTNRTFYVSQGSQLDISKVRVRIDYGDGYLSDEITLSADTATFTQPDTSAAGTFTVSIACKVPDSRGEEIEGTISINVEVPEIVEMYPDNLTCADDNAWSGSMILIYFQNTFPNQANVYPEDLTEAEAATMTDNILFIREGAEVVVDHPGYLTNMLTFIPRINGEAITSYQTGDTILLKQGLCFYRWFGDKDAQNSPVGDGDFVKVGELKYDIPIVYNAQGKFAWQIAAVGGSAIEETVTVGLGQQHAANVTIIPSYATEGEWFYDVADETIASVSTTGMISGLKQGTTTVTATLRDLEGETITTVTFTVVVEDAVSGITITSDTPVVVDIGTELDVAGWIEQFGIKGYAVYASGTTGTEEIDLSGARVTGYDPETEGQQTLTFRVTVDGRSVVGRLTITVGASSGTEEGSGGCSGTVIGASMGAAAAVLVAGAAVLCIRKKKNI